MKKAISSVALLLAILMIITALPINDSLFYAALAIEKTIVNYEQGDLVEFGRYPQEMVTDIDLIGALNEKATDPDTWASYGYYSGEKNKIGTMTKKDYMKYTDITFNGVNYRGVYFTSYRPEDTCYDLSYNTTQQIKNGYEKNMIYWFRYQPLVWVVVNPEQGTLLTQDIIDSQAFNNEVYYPADKKDGEITPYYGKSGCYANNYEKSSIRAWLNTTFLNTAFTSTEQNNITATTRNNTAYDSDYEEFDSTATTDKISLLSYSEADSLYFSRKATGNDYARSQGLASTINSYGEYNNSDYLLRSAGSTSASACKMSSSGYTSQWADVSATLNGIRPTITVSNSAKLKQHGVVPAESITLDKNTINLYESGKATLKATIVPSDSTESIKWTSSDSTVASVNAGVVTTNEPGTATISATTDSGLSASCIVNVASIVEFTCTNYFSAEQTVTIKIADSIDTTGYYWGNSEEYEEEDFHFTDDKSISFKVTEAGTYHLTVFDGSEEPIATRSITFYRTILNANGGNTSATSVLSAEGTKLTLPEATKNGYKCVGWNISPDGDTAKWRITVSANSTYYALWKESDGYTFMTDTYSFRNYSDSDSNGGHCFGISVTSSAYYNGWLDRTPIGGSYSDTLYSYERTIALSLPICHYQSMQGEYAENALVAGGYYYKNEEINTDSDWSEVVNYVKNHEYDNKGTLQISIRGKNGRHAINFLYYKEVDGQQRIYAYDNNYPDKLVYFYKDADGNIKQAPKYTFGTITCIALRDVKKYLENVKAYRSDRSIYAETGTISIEGVKEYVMESDSEELSYSMFTLPADAKTATITAETENATFTYLDTEYSFGENSEGYTGTITLVNTDETDYDEPVFTVNADVMKGDLDKDNRISVADARLALRCAVGLEAFDLNTITIADIDGNGKIDVSDARRILRAAIGLESPEEWKKK